MRLTASLVLAASVLALGACQPTANGSEGSDGAAPTPPAESPPSADALTAEGWGPLRIGMTLDEVVAAAGPDSDPEAIGGPEPEYCDQFRPEQAPEGLLVMIEQGVLTSISIFEPSTLRTDRGFGIGSTAAEIEAAYGDAATVEVFHPDQEPAAAAAGEQPREQRRAQVPNVQVSRWGGGVASSWHIGNPSALADARWNDEARGPSGEPAHRADAGQGCRERSAAAGRDTNVAL